MTTPQPSSHITTIIIEPPSLIRLFPASPPHPFSRPRASVSQCVTPNHLSPICPRVNAYCRGRLTASKAGASGWLRPPWDSLYDVSSLKHHSRITASPRRARASGLLGVPRVYSCCHMCGGPVEHSTRTSCTKVLGSLCFLILTYLHLHFIVPPRLLLTSNLSPLCGSSPFHRLRIHQGFTKCCTG